MSLGTQLSGCSPVPLAHYLKALGILRLVSEQCDSDAAGFWRNDTFILQSALDASGLLKFFTEEYRPTPVVAPWNGGSGFYSKDNTEAIESIIESRSQRFETYQAGVNAARRLIKDLGLKQKPEPEVKEQLLDLCRSVLPEPVLSWLDAVYVIGHEGPKYPPLLGTGGNDGRLEFTNNFMQRLIEVIDPQTGKPTSESATWLSQSLFGENVQSAVNRGPVGQFFPGAAGGANASAGFDAPSSVNPWDFILMIEGAVLFAAATTRKLQTSEQGNLIYPFTVRQTGVGYGSATIADEINARAEMWMPLWENPATLAEVSAVFGEGRAQVGGRSARNGVDFARAIVTLGVDKGLKAFQRYGFQLRNGLAYFATPLNRLSVQRNARVDLLSEIDPWLERFRSKAGPQASPPAPASVSRALNQLESQIFELCQRESPENTQAVLIALGRCEAAMARSLRWTKETAMLRPIAGLSSKWIRAADDGTPEFRLSLCLASLTAVYGRGAFSFRRHLEPVEPKKSRERVWFDWLEHGTNDVVTNRTKLEDTLNGILARRLILAEQSRSRGLIDMGERISLGDIGAFIEGVTDDSRIAELMWGLSLINWPAEKEDLPEFPHEQKIAPSAFYALLKLCFCGSSKSGDLVPLVPAIHQRASHGDGASASALAARRLRASGCAPAVRSVRVVGSVSKRTAAALIFPLRPDQIQILQDCVLRPEPQLT